MFARIWTPGALSGDSLLDLPPERTRVHGREPVELGLDLVEVGQHPAGVDEAALHQRRDVAEVLRVAPLDLGERLRIGVEVVEAEASLRGHEEAPALPAGG